MKTLLFMALIALLAGCGDATTEKSRPSVTAANQSQLHEAIRAQAEDMQSKLMSGDLDGFISYVHPDIIKMAGGADKLRQKMAPRLPDLIKTIEKITMGKISDVVDDGGRLVAFIPVETFYRFPTGGWHQKYYRIACSEDGGKTWRFIDGQGRKDQEEFFRTKFPVLTKKIPFPRCVSEKI